MAPWLVHLTLDRAVQVRALAKSIVLYSWARHFTLTVPLSTQVQLYKWVPANLMLGVTLDKLDKLRPDEPLGSHAGFLFLVTIL